MPNWAINAWSRRHTCASPVEPFALIGASRGLRVVSAVNESAAALGLYPGQKATDAAALCPGLVTAEASPEADTAALEALADWCVRFSPSVAPDPPDGLFLDMTGAAHLWGGEVAMTADLRRRLALNGLDARTALADTAGAAWALARHGATPDLIVPPNEHEARLAPLPCAALRLPARAAGQIERLGLRRIGQLTDLPRAPLARRFGAETLVRLDQALGRSPEALTFRRPPTPWFARRALAEPVSAPDDLARITGDIARDLCQRLEAEGQGGQRFQLGFHRVDGQSRQVEVGLSRAARDPDRLTRLFLPRLDQVDPGFGVEIVTLGAWGVEPLAGKQVGLDSLLQPGRESRLDPLVDRLINRLGAGRVWKARAVESHVPERASAPGPALQACEAGTPAWDPELPRPLRLFHRPEPLESVLALTPDDPPRQFQWRNRLHRVRLAEGPERIGAEWWRSPIEAVRNDQIRDYYRVEDEAGLRLWVFRSGLYDPETPARWWVHGVFA